MILKNVCEIRRKAYESEDAAEPTYTWTTVFSSAPCSLQYKRGEEKQGEFVEITDYELYLPPSYDVQRGDVVVVGTKTFDVVAVGSIFDRFIRVTCKEVSRT